MNKVPEEKRALLVFNPEHDLALASGQPHFMPPASALTFAREAAILPIWIYRKGTLFTQALPDEFLNLLQSLNIDIQLISDTTPLPSNISEIIPWGWDSLLRENLLKYNLEKSIILSEDKILKIKELSNRRLAIKAHNGILQNWRFPTLLPEPAKMANNIETVIDFIAEKENIIMKMPWSGSGKGLRLCRGSLTKHDSGWLKNVIEKQGAAVIEKRYDIVQDFAMEFHCNYNMVEFCGYSLFFNQNGSYHGNYLISNEKITSKLSSYIRKEYLDFCRDYYISFITKEIAPFYNGFVGVDMFVYKEDEDYRLHPACEINLRTTMGVLARKLKDNYIDDNSEGIVLTAYSNHTGELEEMIHKRMSDNKLTISNSKITSGVTPLFPITESSHYCFWIEVEKQIL